MKTQIDTTALKNVDIAAVIQRDLGPAKLQHGGHLRWMCPFHTDHTPSLDVNVKANRVYCNPCGISLDPAGWLMKYRKLTFPEAARELLGATLPTVTVEPAEATPDVAPGPEWQKRARAIAVYGHQQLSASAEAQRWLGQRGLDAWTMQVWQLGYNPRGQRIAGLWVDAGILIPDLQLDGGEYWGIKVRLLPGHKFDCIGCGLEMDQPGDCPKCGKSNKYRGVKGNVSHLYGRYIGRRVVFLVEGEFDAQITWQEADDLGGVATTTAGAANKFRPAWAGRLMDAEKIIVIYDSDAAGERGAAEWGKLGSRLHVARVPGGVKDVTDYYLTGGSVNQWLRQIRAEALKSSDPELVRQQARNASLPASLRADYYADALAGF